MIKGAGLITYQNNYETIDYFSHRLAEALLRRNIHIIFTSVPLLANPSGPARICFEHSLISFTFSFGLAAPLEEMRKIWRQAPIPHLHILIDPLAYAIHEVNDPRIILSSIDQVDCANAKEVGVEKILFFPHAVEKELQPAPDQERIYDVSMFASCYDPDTQKALWRSNYPEKVVKIIEEGIEIALANSELSYWEVVQQAASAQRAAPDEFQWDLVYGSIDYYIRGLDRIALIRSIKDADVHLFGGAVLHYQKNIKGWGRYLADQPNVIIHPAIPYKAALEMMKKSKICLNSAPMYKHGSHERIFAALACGAVPLTTDNLFVREEFNPGEDLLVYNSEKLEEVNDRVNELLFNEERRHSIASLGRQKVMAAHTWDHRADYLLKAIPPLIERIVYESGGAV